MKIPLAEMIEALQGFPGTKRVLEVLDDGQRVHICVSYLEPGNLLRERRIVVALEYIAVLYPNYMEGVVKEMGRVAHLR